MSTTNNKKTIKELSEQALAAFEQYEFARSRRDTNENPMMEGGFDAMLRQAEDAWIDAKIRFAEFFPRVAFSVFIKGPGSNTLASLIEEQTESVTFDFSSMLNEITAPIQTQARDSKCFDVVEYGILCAQIRGWCDNYRIFVPPPAFTQAVYVADESGNVDPIKVRDAAYSYLAQLPSDFFKAIVQARLSSMAAELPIDSSVVPVIITNVNDEMADKLNGSLFEGRGMTIEADDNPTTEDAIAVLRQIRDTVAPEAKTKSSKTQKEQNDE